MLTDGSPPGWYDDPVRPGRLRRWNGSEWTDDVRESAFVAPGGRPANVPNAQLGTLRRRRGSTGERILTIAIGVGVVAIIGVIVWQATSGLGEDAKGDVPRLVTPTTAPSPDVKMCAEAVPVLEDWFGNITERGETSAALQRIRASYRGKLSDEVQSFLDPAKAELSGDEWGDPTEDGPLGELKGICKRLLGDH